MVKFSSLPNDILTEILLSVDSPKDLLNIIRASRKFFDVYTRCRSEIIRSVICQDIQIRRLTQESAFYDAIMISKRSRSKQADVISIFEGLQRFLSDGSRSLPLFDCVVHLQRLYRSAEDDAAQIRGLHTLERFYPMILAVPKHFELPADPPDPVISSAAEGRARHLQKAEQDICRELCREYLARGRFEERLAVQKQVLQRLSVNETESHWWGFAVVETLRHMKRFHDALDLEQAMYDECRFRSFNRGACRDWAKHMLAECSLAGDWDEAMRHERIFLEELGTGWREVWDCAQARQLILHP